MFPLQSFITKHLDNLQMQRIADQNRLKLLAMDDRNLADIGITRGDLEFQARQPSKAKIEAKANRANRQKQKQAIRELRAMTDSDLNDLGISRGSIVEAVKYGRNRIENQPAPAAQAKRQSSRSEQKRAVATLMAMSDAQLEDIGVMRADIADLVRNGKAAPKSLPGKLAYGLATVFTGPVVVADAVESTVIPEGEPRPPRNPVSHAAA